MTDLYREIYKLKQLLRRGWLLRDVPNRTESDAEHCFSMMILALEFMSKNNLDVDQLKVLKMIAYHELCEIDAGDTTIVDNVPKEEKFKKEYEGIKRVAKLANMPEIEELWLEFEERKTKEAKFVKMLDKYDAVMQSKIYSEEYDMPALYEEFYGNGKQICDEINKLKK